MSPITTRWVFFISLVLILPLPFYHGEFALLPVARVFFVVSAQCYFLLLEPGLASPIGGTLLLAAGTLAWLLALWLTVNAYTIWTRLWPSTVRGSVMGLLVFSLLILLSSFPVYRPLMAAKDPITFLAVYD
jgi:hypothetical protein